MNTLQRRQLNYVLAATTLIAFFAVAWLKIAPTKGLTSVNTARPPYKEVEVPPLPITGAIIAYGMGYYDASASTFSSSHNDLIRRDLGLSSLSFHSHWQSQGLSAALESIKHLSYAEQAHISGGMPTVIYLLSTQNYKEALTLLDSGLVLSDLDQAIMPLLNSWILYATGDKVAAMVMLEEEASFDPFISIQLALMGDLTNSKQTASYYQQALELNPDNQFVIKLAENFSARQHDPRQLRLVSTANQAMAEMFNDFAANLLEYQAAGLAATSLDYAQLLNDTSHYSWLLRGVVAYQRQDFTKALDSFSYLGEGSNEYLHAAILRLDIALAQHNLEEAANIYNELSQAFPEDKALVIDFAAGLLANGYHNKVVTLLSENSYSFDDDLQWEADYLLAVAYQLSGDHESGAALLVKKLRAPEPEPLIYHYIGEYLLASGQELPQAVRLLEAAYNTDPYNPEFQASYGIALAKTNRHSEALPILLEALAALPDHEEANKVVGDIYAARKNQELAHKYWRQAGSKPKEGSLQHELALLQ